MKTLSQKADDAAGPSSISRDPRRNFSWREGFKNAAAWWLIFLAVCLNKRRRP
jgi:hypothetical protein